MVSNSGTGGVVDLVPSLMNFSVKIHVFGVHEVFRSKATNFFGNGRFHEHAGSADGFNFLRSIGLVGIPQFRLWEKPSEEVGVEQLIQWSGKCVDGARLQGSICI